MKNTFGAAAISAHIQHVRGAALRELATCTFVAEVGVAPGLTEGGVVELDLRRGSLQRAARAAAQAARAKVKGALAVEAHAANQTGLREVVLFCCCFDWSTSS